MKRLVLLVVALACASVALAGTPASAGASCAGNASNAPDGKIKYSGQPWNGGGSYGHPTATSVLDDGEQVTFSWKWKNVSASTRTIRVSRADWSKAEGFKARFFVGGFDVTSVLRNGKSLAFDGVPPGGSTLRVDLVVTNVSAQGGDSVSALLRGRYGGAPPLACDELRGNVNAS